MKSPQQFRPLVCTIALSLISFCVPLTTRAQTSVLTWHNDNLRDGQNTHETILTVSNVNSTSFGKLFSYTLDGPAYTQPLYVPNVIVSGTTHNVVYLATENNSVYAFDGDGLDSSPLWQDSFLSGADRSVPCALNVYCSVLSPIAGITGTPVIDAVGGTLYVLVLTMQTDGTYLDYLHALDLGSGAEKFGGPVEIQASVAGTGAGSVNGIVTFDASQQLQRPGLLLLNGVVYIAWGSFADMDPYHGWLMGYNSKTLAQTTVFNTTPNGERGAIWETGAGIAADSKGFIYLQTGNGTFDVNTGGIDYGDSFLKLSTTGGLKVADYFTPDNQATLETDDIDLGSGAGVLLPTQSGKYPDEIVSGGKQGLIYLVNRDGMGGYSATANKNIQTVTGPTGGYYNSGAYWNGAIYYHAVSDYLSRYTVKSGVLSTKPISKSPTTFARGSTPSISSNGKTNGIVWAIDPARPPYTVPSVLHAYNAANLADELYNSSQVGTRDQAGPGLRFITPTIVNGKVYVGTANQLDVYGLL